MDTTSRVLRATCAGLLLGIALMAVIDSVIGDGVWVLLALMTAPGYFALLPPSLQRRLQ